MPQSKEDKRNKALQRLVDRRKGLDTQIAVMERDLAAFENNEKSLPTTPEQMRHLLTVAKRDREYVTLEIDSLVAKTIPLTGSAAILQRTNLKHRHATYVLDQHLTDMETHER